MSVKEILAAIVEWHRKVTDEDGDYECRFLNDENGWDVLDDIADAAEEQLRKMP